MPGLAGLAAKQASNHGTEGSGHEREGARKAEPVPSASQNGRNQCSAQASWHCTDVLSESLGGPLPLVGSRSPAPGVKPSRLASRPCGVSIVAAEPAVWELQ